MCAMSQRTHLTQLEAWRVVGRLEKGQTQAKVAAVIGVAQSVISGFGTGFWRLEMQAEDRGEVVDVQQTQRRSLTGRSSNSHWSSAKYDFKIWNRFLETGNASRRSGQGRRRAKAPNEDRYLTLTARRH